MCFLFRNYLPIGKGRALHLNFEPLSPKNALCQVWLKLALWFWRRRRKCEKFTTTPTTTPTTTTTTDNGKFWSEKLTWAFGSGELKTGLFRFYFGVYQYHWLGNFISQSEKNFDIQFHVLDNERGSRSTLYWKKVDKRCIFYLIFVSYFRHFENA